MALLLPGLVRFRFRWIMKGLVLSCHACSNPCARALAIVLLVAGCSGPEALYRSKPGAFPVRTVEDLLLHDEVQRRSMKVRLHYPDGLGPFPLIVYSHGAFCSPAMYDLVTRHWASHGYVVALPHHLDSLDNPERMAPDQLARLLASRVRDLSFLLDARADLQLAVDRPMRIDPERAAVSGHSFGGMIAMIKSGLYLKDGQYDLPGASADPRFDAAVIMSGVGPMPQMTEDAYAGLAGPLFASGGTLDEGNIGTGEIFPWEWRMSPFTLAPAGDKYSLVLEDGDHYLGGLICREDRGGNPDPEGVTIVRAVSTIFLDAYIRGDQAARRYLQTTNIGDVTKGRARFESK